MSNNPLESPIRKISTVSDSAKEIEIGSGYLLKPQVYLNNFIARPLNEKLTLAKDFLSTILKPTIVQLRYRDLQTPTGIKSPRTSDTQLKVNNIYFIDGKLRLIGFLIFQTLMRLNLKFEAIEALIPLHYRHWVFLNCWELSECQDLLTELFTQTDPLIYSIHIDEIPSYNLPRTWFNRFAIREYFIKFPSEFSARLYGNVVQLISEANNSIIDMKNPDKFEQTLEHQVDWLHFGIDLLKALLTHNEIRACGKIGPHLEDYVVEHKLQDKIKWGELMVINVVVDKVLNQFSQFNWTSDLVLLKSDLFFVKMELKEKMEYLIDRKIIPDPIFSDLILEEMKSDCLCVEFNDLSIILHVYFKVIHFSLNQRGCYYSWDTKIIIKLYELVSKLKITPSEFLLPPIVFLKQRLTIPSLQYIETITLESINIKLNSLNVYLKYVFLPDLPLVNYIQTTAVSYGTELGNNIASAFIFLQNPTSNTQYLKHIDQKCKNQFLFECGKEAFLSDRYFESSHIFQNLVEFIEATQSEEKYPIIYKSSKKYSRLSWIKYYMRAGLTSEDLPGFILDPNSLICMSNTESNINVFEELKWNDGELIELGQFYCHLNNWAAAEQLFNIIAKYIKAKHGKNTTHSSLNMAPFQLEQSFIMLGHGAKIFNGFLSLFNIDHPGTICQKMSYKDSKRVVDYPDTFVIMRSSLIKIINIFKTHKKTSNQSDHKTLLSIFFKDIYSTPFPWFFINLISGYLIYQDGFLNHKPVKDFGFGSILACPLGYNQIESLHTQRVIELLQDPRVTQMTQLPVITESVKDFWIPNWLRLIVPILRFGEDHKIPKFIQLQLVGWFPEHTLELPVDEFFIEWFLTLEDYDGEKVCRVPIREKIFTQIPIYTKIIERCVPKLGKIAIAIMSQFIIPYQFYHNEKAKTPEGYEDPDNLYPMILQLVDRAKVKNDEVSLICLLFDYEINRLLCERFKNLDSTTYNRLFKRLNTLEFSPVQAISSDKDPRRYEAWEDAYEFSFRQFWRLVDVQIYYHLKQ